MKRTAKPADLHNPFVLCHSEPSYSGSLEGSWHRIQILDYALKSDHLRPYACSDYFLLLDVIALRERSRQIFADARNGNSNWMRSTKSDELAY